MTNSSQSIQLNEHSLLRHQTFCNQPPNGLFGSLLDDLEQHNLVVEQIELLHAILVLGSLPSHDQYTFEHRGSRVDVSHGLDGSQPVALHPREVRLFISTARVLAEVEHADPVPVRGEGDGRVEMGDFVVPALFA